MDKQLKTDAFAKNACKITTQMYLVLTKRNDTGSKTIYLLSLPSNIKMY